uniref:Uncharacterized protein n=1 Tax=Lepeophtheirus salmonis TaxID=72036 RepID=A0A0K2US48_LEPSM
MGQGALHQLLYGIVALCPCSMNPWAHLENVCQIFDFVRKGLTLIAALQSFKPRDFRLGGDRPSHDLYCRGELQLSYVHRPRSKERKVFVSLL